MSSLMLQHSHIRWKEWIPLVTQQQRFRNLIQIIGYNIGLKKDQDDDKASGEVSYYYTLHRTTMCAPFYTSEKVSSKHPKWPEINFLMTDPSYGSATGLVIRVWEHYKDVDSIVTVWGVYFSGLANIGPHVVPQGRSAFTSNTLVFCMHGGYFTAPDCIQAGEPTLARITAMSLNSNDVRKSYSGDALSRLHSVQRSIKESTEESVALHNKILLGDFLEDRSQIKESSAFLRKLLNQTKPVKVSHEHILAVKRDIEVKKFKIQLLQEQKSAKVNEIKKRTAQRNTLLEENQDKRSQLMNRRHTLNQDMDHLRDYKKAFSEGQDNLLNVKSQFSYRQKQLIAELAFIYPIKKNNENKYTICDVHLPNSEDFDGFDELPLSIALGFTAHVVQMISFIINIPLRYSIIHFGSRSKIVDHITDKIPDKDKEFPLFTKGRDRLQFNYAVYLLNKNIAQLRWYCGISTTDLRTTLPNLETLLNMYSVQKTAKNERKFLSDNLARMSLISRNTVRYSSVPSRFNPRTGEARLSCSLDGGLDKCDAGKNSISSSTRNISEPSCRDDGQSSDSVEQDYTHKYIATLPPSEARQLSLVEKEN